MGWDKERYATDPIYRSRLKEASMAWEKANPARVKVGQRAFLLRRTYGITPADYDAMVARQEGLCAVCQRKPIRRLCVDHSHDTQLLRLLLCHGCNRGLGHFGDNPDFLRAGADYVEIWRIIHARRLNTMYAKPIPMKQ